jgi:putative hydrolase of the HAD superfamily
MIDLKGIKNILFDLGGVLINLDRERCIREFQKLGIKHIEEQIGNSFKSGLFYQLEEDRITPDEFRNKIRGMSSKQVTDNEIDNAWNSFLLEIPSSKLKLLRRLRNSYRVFMVSNTNKIHFDYVVKNSFDAFHGFTMDDYFEKCYLSYELHVSKPDKAFFDAAIRDSGIIPSESLFLDDSQDNINMAQRLGFRTYLVSEKEDYTGKFTL